MFATCAWLSPRRQGHPSFPLPGHCIFCPADDWTRGGKWLQFDCGSFNAYSQQIRLTFDNLHFRTLCCPFAALSRSKVCNLCDATVNFVYARDSERRRALRCRGQGKLGMGIKLCMSGYEFNGEDPMPMMSSNQHHANYGATTNSQLHHYVAECATREPGAGFAEACASVQSRSTRTCWRGVVIELSLVVVLLGVQL